MGAQIPPLPGAPAAETPDNQYPAFQPFPEAGINIGGVDVGLFPSEEDARTWAEYVLQGMGMTPYDENEQPNPNYQRLLDAVSKGFQTSMNPQALAMMMYRQFDEDQESANIANENNFQNIYNKFSDMLGFAPITGGEDGNYTYGSPPEDGGLKGRLEGLYQTGIGTVEQFGEGARGRIEQRYDQSLANMAQRNAARGLGGTTAYGNAALGIDAERERAERDLDDRIAEMMLGVHSGLGTQSILGDQQTFLAMMDFMNSRTDEGPDLAQVMAMMQVLGQAGGGGGTPDFLSWLRGGGQGTPPGLPPGLPGGDQGGNGGPQGENQPPDGGDQGGGDQGGGDQGGGDQGGGDQGGGDQGGGDQGGGVDQGGGTDQLPRDSPWLDDTGQGYIKPNFGFLPGQLPPGILPGGENGENGNQDPISPGVDGYFGVGYGLDPELGGEIYYVPGIGFQQAPPGTDPPANGTLWGSVEAWGTREWAPGVVWPAGGSTENPPTDFPPSGGRAGLGGGGGAAARAAARPVAQPPRPVAPLPLPATAGEGLKQPQMGFGEATPSPTPFMAPPPLMGASSAPATGQQPPLPMSPMGLGGPASQLGRGAGLGAQPALPPPPPRPSMKARPYNMFAG